MSSLEKPSNFEQLISTGIIWSMQQYKVTFQPCWSN